MNRGSPIPALGRLVWHENWAGFGEGAFTILAKLHALNSVGRTYIFQQLGLKKEFNFITGSGVKSNDLSQRIKLASIASQLGSLFTHAASDDRLRYCKTCLSGGYHPTICQLDYFDRCPIHLEALLDSCSNCDLPTPRFVLTKQGSFPSLTCNNCRYALFRKGPLGNVPESWLAPSQLSSIEKFHSWAVSAADRLNLVRSPSWITCCPDESNIKRAALLDVLLKVGHGSFQPAASPLSVYITPPMTVFDAQSGQEPKYFDLALETIPGLANEHMAWNGWATISNGFRVPVDPTVSIDEHAIYIWRSQFESGNTVDVEISKIGLAENLFTRFAQHWSNIYLHFMALLPHHEWVVLADIIWRAAVRIAEAWSQHVRRCHEKNEKVRLNEAWLARLGRWDLLNSSPIGVAKCFSSHAPESVRLFIA